MYEENNSQDKPVVIGIDHGFSLMKTKHHIFNNGVVRCNGRPPVTENSFYYDGSYYCIGGERKTVHEDKTADEDFFLLTLVAVAKEIKTRGLPRTLRVVEGTEKHTIFVMIFLKREKSIRVFYNSGGFLH